jgi:PGF-pre-PGF domain-containing protein
MKRTSLIIMLLILVSNAYAQSMAELPHAFYGTAMINGRDVPVNSLIIAKINDVEEGRVRVRTAGMYGDNPLNRLAVQKGDGVTIRFYVQTPEMENMIEAGQTAEWQQGAVTELDLTFNGEEILKPEDEETSAGGGGGGGGGAPIITQETRFAKSFSDLEPGLPSLLEMDDDNMPLTLIQFYVKNDVAQATVSAQNLLGLPGHVPEQDNVYAYLDITLNMDLESLDTVYIKFHIPMSWFAENNLDKDSVVLMRFHEGSWEPVKTSYVNKDSTYYNYASKLEGFSYFAITADKLHEQEETTTDTTGEQMDDTQMEETDTMSKTEEDTEDSNLLTGLVAQANSSNFKIATIVLAVLLVVVLGYVFYDKFTGG